MLIILHGPDDYRREKKKGEIIAEFLKKNLVFGLANLDLANEESLIRLAEFAKSQPLFGGKKLVILENVAEAEEKELKDILLRLHESQSVSALLSLPKLTSVLKFFVATFSAKATVVKCEFKQLTGSVFRKYISDIATELGFGLDVEAANFLTEVYKENTWGAVTELQKLSSINKKQITKRDLENAGMETSPDFFALVMGLKNPLPATRLRALGRVLNSAEPPAKIFNILSTLWKEKTAQFAALDRAVKLGKLEYEEGLLELALQ